MRSRFPLSLPAILNSCAPPFLPSIPDIAILSVDALESLLSSESVAIMSEDDLLWLLLGLDTEYAPLLRHVRFADIAPDSVIPFASNFRDDDLTELLWDAFLGMLAASLTAPSLAAFDSVILPRFPDIFADIGVRSCRLLWRGSRDGFGRDSFDYHCYGRPRLLVVILDTGGNVFGGFKPGFPETPEDCTKPENADSFIFTFTNPGNLPPRVFSLKKAIRPKRFRSLACLLLFGFGDLVVSVDGNLNTNSSSECFGRTYENDSGRAGNSLLTGSTQFRVREIEAFEVN
jgi:hypothetical protein